MLTPSQDPTDRISLVCAYLALLPQALGIVYTTLILSTREVEIFLAFAGQLGCELLNFGLKRWIKEERPRRIHGKGYGMPSSHAQFVAYWSVFLALFLLVRHVPANKSKSSRPWSLVERVAVTATCGVLAAATAWSRVYLGYHTTKQVLVGSAVGAFTAVAWFVVTTVARKIGLLGWALDTPLAKMLRVRDLVVEEDMCQAGWEKWEDKKVKEAKVAKKTQ